jgi:hypothetical protein
MRMPLAERFGYRHKHCVGPLLPESPAGNLGLVVSRGMVLDSER